MNSPVDRDRLDHTLQQLNETRITRDDIDAVLNQLAERLELDSLRLDENNTAELTVDDSIALYLVYLTHQPGLIAAIPLPARQSDRPEVLAQLLQANLSWELTQGGIFGMVPGFKEPMLCRLMVITDRDRAQVDRLDRDLAGFVELATAWRRGLTRTGQVESNPPPTGFVPGLRV